MAWTKLKNIIICILLATNLCLLAFTAYRGSRNRSQQAQARAQQMERQMEEDMRAKKLAAAQALEGARNQVIRYLDAFNITRDKLAATYNELDALVEQIPRPDSPVIELERDGLDENWSYPGSQS